MKRTFTNNFIIGVDYAFKGKAQRSYIYWISHFAMLLFFFFRSIFILNTPDVVHVPRLTLQENILEADEYYQFRKSFDDAEQHPTLLSHPWKGKKEMEFAYYRDLYIKNEKNHSDEFIVTTPARAPRNYYRNGYLR